MTIEKVNIKEKLGQLHDYYNPRIAGELNGQYIKLVKLKGDFIWHQHADEDEMFLVIEGNLNIELRDKILKLKAGEFVIIPKGVEHKPAAKDEVHIMLFEPASTLNTGDKKNEFTRQSLEKI